MDIVRKDRINPGKKIIKIEKRMHVIRELVKQNGDLAHDYFGEWYELETNLRILDPDNPELGIGIHGKPYFAGLKD